MIKALNTLILITSLALMVPQNVFGHDALIAKVHGTTHVITEETVLDSSKCSGTAIGPHAILTASHCEQATNIINIDGKDAKILGIVRDDADHTVYLIDMKFTQWAVISNEESQMGDSVFIIGNPGGSEDLLRKGYVVSVKKDMGLFLDIPTFIIYDLNGYKGDSGSAVFDDQGEVSGVISVIHVDTDKEDSSVQMKLMAGFELRFTPQQIEKVVSFGQ